MISSNDHFYRTKHYNLEKNMLLPRIRYNFNVFSDIFFIQKVKKKFAIGDPPKKIKQQTNPVPKKSIFGFSLLAIPHF